MKENQNILKVYPTSRAIREVAKSYQDDNMFLPTLMRIDEFEDRAISTDEDVVMMDKLERIFLLREVIGDTKFTKLKYNLDLVHFFTQSDAIFKFFEELSLEGVAFENLRYSDTYGEFEEHIDILENLFLDYQALLKSRSLTDKSLLPQNYTLNNGFISYFDVIEIFIEGYFSNFEFELMDSISKVTNLILYFQTSKFTKKMQDRFKLFGLDLEDEFDFKIDFTNKKILSKEKISTHANIKVISTKERFEQVGIAFMEIQKMIDSGIQADKIALITPDESIKDVLDIFDKHNNLNFAMGFDYKNQKIYKILEALEQFWKTLDAKDYQRVLSYGLNLNIDFDFEKNVDCKDFFVFLNEFKLIETPLDENSQVLSNHNAEVQQKYFYISMVFSEYILSYKEWLHLWMNVLSDITIDDIGGGKITVMGALESRSIVYDGVVIIDFNEGIIPSLPSKDSFLNSSVREFAKLPTKNDREALQKQLYKRVIQRSKNSIIIYSTSDEKLPSKFIYELGFKNIFQVSPSSKLYYEKVFLEAVDSDIEVVFDPYSVLWSSTMLKIFLECKRKYYYRYIKNIKQKKTQEENEGSFIHKLLEKVFENEKFFEKSENLSKKISNILETMLDNSPYGLYQKLLYSQMLTGFIQNQILHFKAGWRVSEVEKIIRGNISGLEFQGRCDRVDQDNTSTFVIDYKTGKSNKENKSKNIETQKDFQMNIYKEILGKQYKNLNLAFVKVFDGGVFEEVKNFEEKDQYFFEAIDELKKTKTFINSKCEDLKTCEYCEFALMCQRGEYI
ncbi:MAG: PD-(D/E)XK nuclease family protein [Sulfurovaceae bacterium]|nr:PD-(D/E)XK nuclease family protein [Sulfurovaceae bacterium]